MSVAEGVSARVAYKAYSVGTMTSNSEPTPTSDPAVTGGQILRRVTSTLKLGKDAYQSAEIRSDRQIADYRHGIRRVTGSITGELSANTYGDLFEAAMRASREAAISASNTDFTSVSADNTAGTFIFTGGDPVSKGFRVGMIARFGTLSDTGNNSKNFVILGFSGASNRTMTVFPKPNTMTADSSFTVTSTGKRLFVPSTGQVSRKFGIEHYHSDIDVAKLFTECRIAGFNINLPATGMATCEFPVMGRNMQVYSATNAPFFTGPTAATTTGVFAAVNGLCRVGGNTVGVVTAASLAVTLSPSADAVVGQNFPPEVFLGRFNATGRLSAEFEDSTFLNNFANEDELEVLIYLTASSAAAPSAQVLYLPRIKFTDMDNPAQGEGAQVINMPFQALLKPTGTAGVESTTFQLCDTDFVA